VTTAYDLKSNGTRGEITPLAHARSDKDFYKAAWKTLRNWISVRFGAITRRSGTRFRGTVKDQIKTTELLPFIFSATQAYWLEFGDLYIRFWKPDGTRVESSPGVPYEVVTPYAADDVHRIQWEQANDVMYLAHPDYKPRKLSRFGETNWTLSVIDFVDGPYLPINDTKTTMQSSASPTDGATTTITASAITGINKDQGFKATDVGRLFRMQIEGKYSWGVITTFTDTTNVNVTWTDGNGGGTGTTKTWRLGAFSDTTGYPGSVSFDGGRLAWARTDNNPGLVAESYAGLPESYRPSDDDGTVTDAHGFTFDIFAAGEIQWLQEATKLQVGTPLALRTLGAQGSDDVITARNAQAKLEINTGTVAVPPVRVGPSTVHAGLFGLSLNDLVYDYNINSLTAPELSVLAEHLFDAGVKRISYAQYPDRIVWVVDEDGALIGMTLDRDEKVVGFHHHPMTNGVVESICTIPYADEKRHATALIVRRTIEGQTKRYFETLEPLFKGRTMAPEDACFVDCAVTYDGVETTTITGATHLSGQTVDILADGCVFPQRTVSVAGTISLPRAASKVTYGIPIDNLATTLPPLPETRDGATMGREKRTIKAYVDQMYTNGLTIGPEDGVLERMRFRPPETPMGQAPALYTGVLDVSMDDGWSTDGSVSLAVVGPLPGMVRAINSAVDLP
jgi:hypothetical protein